MPRKTPFAERLQRILIEKNLTQSAAARLIWGTMTDERGYEVPRNRQALGKYLRGTREPRIGTKRRIANALGVPLSALDPESDPIDRPGSGIYCEEVGRNRVRLEVNMEVPDAVAREAIGILAPYSV